MEGNLPGKRATSVEQTVSSSQLQLEIKNRIWLRYLFGNLNGLGLGILAQLLFVKIETIPRKLLDI